VLHHSKRADHSNLTLTPRTIRNVTNLLQITLNKVERYVLKILLCLKEKNPALVGYCMKTVIKFNFYERRVVEQRLAS